MRTWTPNGHRLSGAVFWVIWTIVVAAVGGLGAYGLAMSGDALWSAVFGLGAALLFGFGAIFGRYAEFPRWPIGALVAGAMLCAAARPISWSCWAERSLLGSSWSLCCAS
jgi:hypothetical protein